jgi:hypothetical protein
MRQLRPGEDTLITMTETIPRSFGFGFWLVRPRVVAQHDRALGRYEENNHEGGLDRCRGGRQSIRAHARLRHYRHDHYPLGGSGFVCA